MHLGQKLQLKIHKRWATEWHEFIEDTVGDQTTIYHCQVEVLGSTTKTEWQLFSIRLLEGWMQLSYTEVADEKGHPYTKWVIYKEWLVYKLIKLILSHSYAHSKSNQSSFLHSSNWGGVLFPKASLKYYIGFIRPHQVGLHSFVHPDSSWSLCRASPAYFDASMMIVWSLSIFDRLVVSVKVSLSYNKQVGNLSLKTCIEVLTGKELARTMSEGYQCDRLWTLYMFLPCNPTLETSPHGMVGDPPSIEVAEWYLTPHQWTQLITSPLTTYSLLTWTHCHGLYLNS